MKRRKELVARLDNQLVMKAHYNLSTNEQKLILYLVSMIDSNRDDFNVQRVKIKDIERVFAGDDKRWGTIYERVNGMCDSISSKKITLPKGFVVDGEPVRMNRFLQWFTDIEPYTDEDGEIAIKFQFGEPLKPFLLQLSEYVRIGLGEVMPMRGKHAIRMYQVFTAERNRTRKFKKVSHLTYGLDELKAMLGIVNQYKATQDFKRRVLNTMRDEVNEYSHDISVDYELLRGRRNKITGIEFSIRDKKKIKEARKKEDLPDYVPSVEEVGQLSRAKYEAYQKFVAFGVKEGIAYRQLLPRIKGEVFEGFEDYFAELAIEHFKAKSKAPDKVGAFVKWWVNVESFDSAKGEDWVGILEATVEKKKKLEPTAYTNRMEAKNMTRQEFNEWYREQEKQEKEATGQD
jgi:plasmid replication initiation protein